MQDVHSLGLEPEQERRVRALIEEASRRERERAVALCRARARLWESTDLANFPAASAREEARARANEASYLADLLAGSSFAEVRGG